MEALFNNNFNDFNDRQRYDRALVRIDRDYARGFQTHSTLAQASVIAGREEANKPFYYNLYELFGNYYRLIQWNLIGVGDPDDAWDFALEHMQALGWIAFRCNQSIRFYIPYSVTAAAA